jgi:hypothetical protein
MMIENDKNNILLSFFSCLYPTKWDRYDKFFYHDQLINVATAGAQAFLMDYLQGERAIILHAGPVRIGGS